MAKFHLFFEFRGCSVEGHSGAKKFKKSVRVSVSRFVVALNKGSAKTMVGFFYSRCDFCEKTVSDIEVIIRSFWVIIDLGADRSNGIDNKRKVSGEGLNACKGQCSLPVFIIVVTVVVCNDVVVKGFGGDVELCSVFCRIEI